MRADAAPGNGVAHHDVVQARLRDEREAAQQRVGCLALQVYAAHQQGEVAAFESNPAKRPMRGIPAVAAAFHDPGFDVVAPRERVERAPLDDAGESGQRGRDEERALLPMPPQKLARGEPAEQ
jgi:hypothetical protein